LTALTARRTLHGTVPEGPASLDLRELMRLVRFPSWIVDRSGRVVWENDAANRLFGDQRGKLYSSFVAPEYLALAQEQFARKLLGQQVTDYEVDLLTADGSRVRVETSVPLPSAEGEIPLGVFGLGRLADVRRESPLSVSRLTPRQA
jgi:PAS domain S-box-containing protein